MNIDFTGAWQTIQGWINGFITLLPNIVVAILAFIAFYFVGKGIRHFIAKATTKHQRSRHVGLVVGRLMHGIVGVMGFLIALMIVIPSITAAQLVSALGVSSIAIGFAFKDILQNFLAGILILLTQPFKIGDWIVVDKYEGAVLNIETRATTMQTYDNYVVVIPNTVLFTGSVTVLTANNMQRVQYDFSIKYGQDLERAKEIILEAIGKADGVLKDPPPDVMTVEMAVEKITLRGRWWSAVSPREWLVIRDRIIEEVGRRFAEEFDIPPRER